jgi:hypothetical protein
LFDCRWRSRSPPRRAGEYINTHSGHPGRLDDNADDTPFQSTSICLACAWRRLVGGITRTRIDPGFTWGALRKRNSGFVSVIWLNRPGAGRAARPGSPALR